MTSKKFCFVFFGKLYSILFCDNRVLSTTFLRKHNNLNEYTVEYLTNREARFPQQRSLSSVDFTTDNLYPSS